MIRFAHILAAARTARRVPRLLTLLALVPCLLGATPHLHRCDAPHDHGAPPAAAPRDCFCAPCECSPCFHGASAAALAAAPPALRKRCAPRPDAGGHIVPATSRLRDGAAVAAHRRCTLPRRACVRTAAVLRI